MEDPRAKETERHVQKIIEFKNIACKLPDAFTNIKGVTKSLPVAINVLKRIEVPNKIIHLPSQKKRSTTISKIVTSRKRTRKQRN